MPELNISLKLVTGDSISGPGFYIFIMDHDWGLRTRSVQAATLTCGREVRSASVCICYISNQLRFIGSRSTLTHSIYLFTHLWPPANTFLLAPGLTSYILQSLVFVFSSLHSVFKFLGSILFSGELVGVLFIHHQWSRSIISIKNTWGEGNNWSWKMGHLKMIPTFTEFHHWHPKDIQSVPCRIQCLLTGSILGDDIDFLWSSEIQRSQNWKLNEQSESV